MGESWSVQVEQPHHDAPAHSQTTSAKVDEGWSKLVACSAYKGSFSFDFMFLQDAPSLHPTSAGESNILHHSHRI